MTMSDSVVCVRACGRACVRILERCGGMADVCRLTAGEGDTAYLGDNGGGERVADSFLES